MNNIKSTKNIENLKPSKGGDVLKQAIKDYTCIRNNKALWNYVVRFLFN